MIQHTWPRSKAAQTEARDGSNPGWHPSIIHAAAQTEVSRWKKTSRNTVVLTNEEAPPTALGFS